MTATQQLKMLVPALLKAVPEFQPDDEDVRENNAYLVFEGLVQFAFDLHPESDLLVLRRIFAFLEDASRNSDKEVQMLLHDVAWSMAEHWKLAELRSLIGPHMMKFIKMSPAGGKR
jgi:hypothetical protein